MIAEMSDGLATTLGQALAKATARLAAAGCESPRRDARLLLAAARGEPGFLVFADDERPLAPRAAGLFHRMIDRRVSREPVSRILGEREFWSLPIGLGPETLDPRPESETLVEAVLARLESHRRPYRVLDLGTGSGCLLLALLSELPAAWGLGLDRSPGALATARATARRLGLAERAGFLAADWNAEEGGALRVTPGFGGFDILVANPPYVAEGERDDLDPEVREYDPPGALFAGPDGLADYRALVPRLRFWAAPGALVAFESGAGQMPALAELLREHDIPVIAVPRDLSGIERCVIGRFELPRSEMPQIQAFPARKTVGMYDKHD